MRTCEGRTVSKVFVNIGRSLDGYVAPEGMNMEDWEHENSVQ